MESSPIITPTATNEETNATARGPEATTNAGEQIDLVRVLGTLMRRFDQQDDMVRQTNARLDSLATAQNVIQEQLDSSRPANLQHPRANSSPSLAEGGRPAIQHRIIDFNTPSRTPISMQLEHATHSREHSPAQDSELENIKASLREMQSKVRQALSSVPEIDRVLEETQRTPFTDRITAVPIRHTTKLRIESFGGTTNPKHFMTSFAIAMGRIQLSPEEREAAYCQLFVEHLVGSALDWFSRLRPSSIESFA